MFTKQFFTRTTALEDKNSYTFGEGAFGIKSFFLNFHDIISIDLLTHTMHLYQFKVQSHVTVTYTSTNKTKENLTVLTAFSVAPPRRWISLPLDILKFLDI